MHARDKKMFPPALSCCTAFELFRDEFISCISYSVDCTLCSLVAGCYIKSSIGARSRLHFPSFGHVPLDASGPICGHSEASVLFYTRHSSTQSVFFGLTCHLFVFPDTYKILFDLAILWDRNKFKICKIIVRYYPRPRQESRWFENFHGLFCSRNLFYVYWPKLLTFLIPDGQI